ncbi:MULTISPECIES: SDR family oxidoreductase [Flavobacterium]|uniref:SDR family oxidoreductase n=1 Tax=Flavobacterium TaxID=237 RepID=UPI002113F4DE|nr:MULTISPECIES: SDR family oxidoreductase [Flavobacterium]UUF12439.1 SDR family oxidoreductase [Flavobacterium panici]
MKKLENKVAVITGGNSGMGLSTAILFAEHGAKVAITGRNAMSLNEAAKLIGDDTVAIVSNVTDLDSIGKTYKKVADELGKIDVLVVNAGVFIAAPLSSFTEEQFDQTSDINFKGAFFSVQRALPYLNEGASIILTSSAMNAKGVVTGAAYAASKAAVRSLARSFSAELIDRKIRVNVVSPGPTDTPLFGRGGGSDEEINGSKNYFAGLNPSKRIATAKEVAQAFLYLASDDSKFILGSEIVIDGGVKEL